jgi:murein tripeptide amidase MpaA
MSRPPRTLAAVLAVFLLGAFQTAAEAARRYDGFPVLRVTVETPDQLAEVQRLAASVWSEHIGLGQIDVLVAPEGREQLDRLGLSYAVMIPDVQVLIDGESAARDLRDATWFQAYKTYSEINAYADELVALRPDLINKYPIGTSIEGRTIYGLTITSPAGGPNKPAVCINGTQHAREWISPMTVMYIADRLVRGYDTDPEVHALLDAVTFYVAPIINPDGFVWAWEEDRMWRKNRRNNGDGTYGVDLNRNWDAGFGGPGAEGLTSSDVYHGTAAFSEPETWALRDYLLSHPDVVAHIDFHSYGQLVLRPYGYAALEAAEPDKTLLRQLGDGMADAIFDTHGKSYTSQPSYELYLASGTCADWVYMGTGAYSWTIELRDKGSSGFILPPGQILPTAEEAYAAFMHLSDWASQQVRTTISLPAGAPELVAPGVSQVVDVKVVAIGESLVPDSLMVRYRDDGGAWESSPLTHIEGALYRAILPPARCGDTPEYYFVAAGSQTGSVTNPAGAPGEVYVAQVGELRVSFADDFETATGWSTEVLGATSGQWQRGTPVNDPDWAYDPMADGDGSGQCYLTQNEFGNTDVDDGAVRLTSPVVDLSGSGTSLEYDYFLRLTNSDGSDRLLVEVQDVGGAGPWTEIARHASDGGLSWRHHRIDASALVATGVTLTASMRVRFTANDADTQSIVESGVDGFSVVRVECMSVFGDGDGDGDVDLADYAFLAECLGGPEAGVPASCQVPLSVIDADGDEDVDLEDFSVFQSVFGAE